MDRIYKQTDKDAYSLEWMRGLNQSGYLGCNRRGTLVDRREFPDVMAVRPNSMFGIAEPRPLYECQFSDSEIKYFTQEEIDEAQKSADEFDGFIGFAIMKILK